jgi:glycosyltransferase involved in cell wall biosynthesis
VSRIRIGIDAWNLPGDHRGIGRYLREILRVWWERYRDRVEITLIVPEWHTWTVAPKYLREVEGRPYRVVSRKLHRLAPLDVLWFPFNGCSWTSFTLPAVATLHDASNFVVPDYAPSMRGVMREAVARCRELITLSEFSRSELARELPVPIERITAVLCGVNAPLPVQTVALDVAAFEPFMLYVGTPEWRKGFDVALETAAIVQTARPNMQLVVTGSLGEWAQRLGTQRVRALNFVDDATLAALYRACTALVFPSRYEGFGLPVLEALNYGAPVVASNASAIPEAGGDAVRYVAEGDAAATAAAVLDVTADPQRTAQLRELGLARAASMTWDDTALATLRVFERALAG